MSEASVSTGSIPQTGQKKHELQNANPGRLLSYSELTEAQLREIYKPTIHFELDVTGEHVTYDVFDFREGGSGRVELYFDGFGQTKDTSLIKATFIDKARKDKGLLVLPRLPKIPKVINNDSPQGAKFDSQLDARVMLQGLESPEAADKLDKVGIKLDFSNSDLTISGFSDGNRNAIEAAGYIESKYPPTNSEVARRLNLWSLISVVDMVPEGTDATGQLFLDGTVAEFTDITFEEFRWRLNSLVYNDPETWLNRGYQPTASSTQSSEKKALAIATAKLFLYGEGRESFFSHLNEAKGKNLKALKDVVGRAMTARSRRHFLDHLAKNEVRSPVCDNLSTFDVRMSIPRQDKVTKFDSLGRTVKELTASSPEIESRVPDNFAKMGDEQLGHYVLEEADHDLVNQVGSVLFPKARSVAMNLVGRKVKTPWTNGDTYSITSSHLGPVVNPFLFEAASRD